MKIISSCCKYKTDKTGKEIPAGVSGTINYYFELKDQTGYSISYDIERDGFYSLDKYSSTSPYYKTKEELEEEGAEKDGDKFIVPLTGEEKELTQEQDTQWVIVPME